MHTCYTQRVCKMNCIEKFGRHLSEQLVERFFILPGAQAFEWEKLPAHFSPIRPTGHRPLSGELSLVGLTVRESLMKPL